MAGQTIILVGAAQRNLAKSLIDQAPRGAVVNVREATRNRDQNAKMWAMLSDVSRAKPEGRMWPLRHGNLHSCTASATSAGLLRGWMVAAPSRSAFGRRA